MKIETQFISKTLGIQGRIKRKINDFKVKEIPAFSYEEKARVQKENNFAFCEIELSD